MAKTSEVGSTIASGAVTIFALASIGDPGQVFMAPLIKMFQFIKYMNITYPAQVELLLSKQSSNRSLLAGINKRVTNAFRNYPLPEKFEFIKFPQAF